MKREIVTGNKALAERLGVSIRTIGRWKKEGALKSAILSGPRKIIYDVEKARKCQQQKQMKKQRQVPARMILTIVLTANRVKFQAKIQPSARS